MIALWLDEEWCPQEVHAQLGRAAGDAYARLRAAGAFGCGQGSVFAQAPLPAGGGVPSSSWSAQLVR